MEVSIHKVKEVKYSVEHYAATEEHPYSFDLMKVVAYDEKGQETVFKLFMQDVAKLEIQHSPTPLIGNRAKEMTMSEWKVNTGDVPLNGRVDLRFNEDEEERPGVPMERFDQDPNRWDWSTDTVLRITHYRESRK